MNNCCQQVTPLHRTRASANYLVRWSPLCDGWVKWNLDGSVQGRHQLASSGSVLLDSSGRWLCGMVRNIGSASVTCAELWAFKDTTHVFTKRSPVCVL
ncbi:Reverse transcriptase-like [Sesbania bispinosa]|nr:Reverse transcriptase-like [Sesbania bispinosa]